MDEPPTPSNAPRACGPGTGKVVVLLVLAALFAYYNSLHAAYIFDDAAWIKEPEVSHPLQSALTRTRPVVTFSLYLNYALDGLNGRGYHLLNAVIHTLAALVLYDLFRRTLLLPRFGDRFADRAGWLGLIVALVWLVHPLNTQSVTYTIQRCESLMGLFYLLALWCFLRGAMAERRAWAWFTGAVVACVLSVGCKEVAFTIPAVVVLYDRTFLAGSWRGVLRRWPVYLVLTIPVAAGFVNISTLGLFDKAGDVGFGVKLFTPKSYLFTQTEVILYYIRLSFWPSPLCLDYIGWAPKTSLAQVWPQATAVSALVLASFGGAWMRWGAGFLGAAFFLILAPTSSFLPIQDAAFEHRMYLPLIAVLALVVLATDALLARLRNWAPGAGGFATRAVATGAGCVVVLFGWMTVVRNEDYSSLGRMYADIVQKNPDNFRARGTYSALLLLNGKPEQAEEMILPAVRSPLQLPNTLMQYMSVLREVGKVQEALDLGVQLRAARPDDPQIALEYGRTLVAAGRPAEAVPVLRSALARPDDRRVTRLYLIIALTEAGEHREAQLAADELRSEEPGAVALFRTVARNVAMTPEAKKSDVTLALQIAGAVLLTDPSAPESLDALAICQARAGRYEEAVTTAGRAADRAAAAGWAPNRVALIRERQALFAARHPFLSEFVR